MKLTDHQIKVFEDRYQHNNETVDEMFQRVAEFSTKDKTILGLNKKKQIELFYNGLMNKQFTPAGRVFANSGVGYNNMLFNCFVIGIDDSRQSITSSLGVFMEIAALGGGIGSSFGSLRPEGDKTITSKGTASGPVSFINVFQELAVTIKQAGSRGLATLITMPIFHPDIEKFIVAKYEEGRWANANISIGITDEFMRCVEGDFNYNLVWNKEVRKTINAKKLWDKICTLAHRNGEPGILFLDTMNEDSSYKGYEILDSTNPCGEVPLPHNGACNLGSVIVSSFIDIKTRKIDYSGIRKASYNLTLWLDNLIDISTFPTKDIETMVKKYRPIGIGIMGLADLFLYHGVSYGSIESQRIADKIGNVIELGSLEASEALAVQFGAFPAYDQAISKFPPRRNITLTSYAPTGSISALFNVSSGIEAMFAPSIKRNEELGVSITQSGALGDYMKFYNLNEIPKHASFSVSGPKGTEVTTQNHIDILKAFIPYAQSGISKTIILDNKATVEEVSKAYLECWKARSKGVTVYRTGSRSNAPIESADKVDIVEADYEDIEVEFIDYSVAPKKRPNELEGATYKVKFNYNQHSMFITINDFEGELYEIFFKINNSVHQEYLDGLSRAITTLWRRGIDTTHLMGEFAEYESLSGGSFYEYEHGKTINLKSILHAISVVVTKHNKLLGDIASHKIVDTETIEEPKGEKCPECGQYTLIRSEGCSRCISDTCTYYRCG